MQNTVGFHTMFALLYEVLCAYLYQKNIPSFDFVKKNVAFKKKTQKLACQTEDSEMRSIAQKWLEFFLGEKRISKGFIGLAEPFRKVFTQPHEEKHAKCTNHENYIDSSSAEDNEECADDDECREDDECSQYSESTEDDECTCFWGKPLEKIEEIKCSNKTCDKIETPNNKFKFCSICKVACYCSVECQKSDWKAGHKQLCKKVIKTKQ